jgi:hypothetical protein
MLKITYFLELFSQMGTKIWAEAQATVNLIQTNWLCKLVLAVLV